MDKRTQELIDLTKTKFGLEDYYLKRHHFYRNVSIFNDTVYTLCMEWFPNHSEEVDDDSNPDGTAVIEIKVDNRKFVSAIFVMGKTYAKNGVQFNIQDKENIIKWVEQETGFTYGKQFELHREEAGELFFKECANGISVSPSGIIEVKYNDEGALTMFSHHGPFSSQEKIQQETYTLSFAKIEHLAKQQLKLMEIPSYEQKKFIPVYAVEEIYVRNDGTLTIPFEFIVDVRSYLKVGRVIHWDAPINKPFERKEINWIEDITAEQAFSCEPSPDSFPLTEIEMEKCIVAVEEFLRQEYPRDTGKWNLRTFHRENGYIHATLRADKQDNGIFQRKIKAIIDAKQFHVVNFMDNQPMLEIYEEFQAQDKIDIIKEEAYEKLKSSFELKPYYVYDFELKQYVLCGKLDCQYGVNASSGEVMLLDDL